MDAQIKVALIGVGGVVAGTMLAEILRFIHVRRDQRGASRRLRGHLIGVCYEIRGNTLLVRDLKKFALLAMHRVPNTARTAMLDRLRDCYDDLDTQTIQAVEDAYGSVDELAYLVGTGTAIEYKKWATEAEKTVSVCEAALAELGQALIYRGVQLPVQEDYYDAYLTKGPRQC